MGKKKYFIHSSSFIEKDAKVGENTQIWHFCHIMQGAKVGKNCKIGQNVVIHPTAVVGNYVKIQNNVSVYDAVTLEDYVFCGPACVFTNIINPRSAINRNSSSYFKKTLVKKGATIGANATIVCGVTIGKYALIGAGTVITKDVGDYELIYGAPAKRQGWMSEHGEKLIFKNGKAVCPATKQVYKKEKNVISRIK